MKVRNVFSDNVTVITGCKNPKKYRGFDWKTEITNVCGEFHIPKRKISDIILAVCSTAKPDDPDIVLYERAHRKMMALI